MKGETALLKLRNALYFNGEKVKSQNWQGDTSGHDFIELLNYRIEFDLCDSVSLAAQNFKPNQPWANQHFEERVSGIPMNPPPSHKLWLSKTEEYLVDGRFSHSYPERMWSSEIEGHKGIRYPIGNLLNIVEILNKDKHSRQAYLPIFFPEDLTAACLDERIPCTLGWHFIIRNNELNMFYPMRSVDVIRHIHNDFYLANRLTLWVRDRLNEKVKMGKLNFFAVSLHCFENDRYTLKKIIGA